MRAVVSTVIISCVISALGFSQTAVAAPLSDNPEVQVWAGCPLDDSRDVHKRVRTWGDLSPAVKRHLGPSTEMVLYCGNRQGDGFRHIANRHGQDWQNLAYVENRNWRDLVDMSITRALTDPVNVKSEGNGKVCATGEIYLVNRGTGELAAVKRSRIIMSANNSKIITAFPHATGC